jgi:hypothetical protein
MGYYRGDYYRGDYYRGDYYRGDLGGFFKKAAGVVGGAVKGFITGGPLGAVSGAAGAIIRRPSSNSAAIPAVGMIGTQAGILGTGVKIATKVLPPLLAGKEIYDFGTQIFGGSNGRKRRTMNHLNPRALSRATRRVEGFVKKARKAVSPLGYTIQRRGAGRVARRRSCK